MHSLLDVFFSIYPFILSPFFLSPINRCHFIYSLNNMIHHSSPAMFLLSFVGICDLVLPCRTVGYFSLATVPIALSSSSPPLQGFGCCTMYTIGWYPSMQYHFTLHTQYKIDFVHIYTPITLLTPMSTCAHIPGRTSCPRDRHRVWYRVRGSQSML